MSRGFDFCRLCIGSDGDGFCCGECLHGDGFYPKNRDAEWEAEMYDIDLPEYFYEEEE